ncbi:MAG TPA: arginase [Burkholderiales bacterium]|jgi:arginase|nr:arginase [Burkholderiales bacterium]
MQRQIELIGAGWGLGGADPGCADAPEALAPLLTARLKRCGRVPAIGPMLRPVASERRKQLAVSKLCGLLASAVAEAIRREYLPCVLGGDHSCAGGTWTGVARALQARGSGALGLVWVDAHMDSHTPSTSHTGRLHGMPLAWLLGQHDDPLYGLSTGVIDPAHVCLIGVRSYEPEEEERLKRLGVRVMMMEELARRGLDDALDEALQIAGRGTADFGISIDLDVVSPEEAPAVGTPASGGLPAAALVRGLQRIGGRANLAAVELVEYSPRLDPDGRTAQVAIDLLAAALGGPGEDAQVGAEPLERH